jgi:hypothetical protein
MYSGAMVFYSRGWCASAKRDDEAMMKDNEKMRSHTILTLAYGVEFARNGQVSWWLTYLAAKHVLS